MQVYVTEFGVTKSGAVALRYCMENANGMVVKITNYGGIITDICVPDKNGLYKNVCLGFDSLAAYLGSDAYFGALIGRYANRIRNGRFELEGNSFQLCQNDFPHHLHGGSSGFDKKIWNAEVIQRDDAVAIKLTYLSPDGDEGYPGNCHVTAVYELNNNNEISLSFEALCDQATPINLTQHSYFNLSDAKDIYSHQVTINSSFYAPINKNQLPIGLASAVVDTPFDFRNGQLLAGIDCGTHIQTSVAKGFNHYFFLDENPSKELSFAAKIMDSLSGRVLEIFTTAPGIQFYSGGFLNESELNGGNSFGPHSGLCFEPQYCPDSINQPMLPSTVLHPGQKYLSKTVYKFSVSTEDS